MVEKTNSYATLFSARVDVALRYRQGVILLGEGALVAGTVLLLDPVTKKYKKMANTTSSIGAVILAEDIDATAADASGKVLLSGGIDEDKLVFAGVIAAFDESVRAILAMNNIFVGVSTDNITNV